MALFASASAFAAEPGKPAPCYCGGEITPEDVGVYYPRFNAAYHDADDRGVDVHVQIGADNDWTAAETWDSGWTAVAAVEDGKNSHSIVYSGSGLLTPNTSYYWRIRYRDEAANPGNWSDTQEFKTAPTLNNRLEWDASPRAAGYYVHFGTSADPPFNSSTVNTYWDPGELTYDTEYYWKVFAYNAGGNSSTTTWSFRTAPNPYNISGARMADSNVRLYLNGVASGDDNGTGTSYSIPLPDGSAGDVIHVIVTGGTGNIKAATIGKRGSASGSISGFDVSAWTITLFNSTITNNNIGLVDPPNNSNDPYDISIINLATEWDTGITVKAGATYSPGGSVTLTQGALNVEPGGTLNMASNLFYTISRSRFLGSNLTFANLTIGDTNGYWTNSSVSLTVTGTCTIYNGCALYIDGGKTLTIAGTGKLKMHDAVLSGAAGCEFGNGCQVVLEDGADLDLIYAGFYNLANEGVILGAKGTVTNFKGVEFRNPYVDQIGAPYVYLKVTSDTWNNSTLEGPVSFYCNGSALDGGGRVHEFVNSGGFDVGATWITLSNYVEMEKYICGTASEFDYGFKGASGFIWGTPQSIESFTWTGNESNVWTAAANWTPRPVGPDRPGYGDYANTSIIIAAASAYDPELPGLALYFDNVSIESGATLNAAGNDEMYVKGRWINDGAFMINAANYSVNFCGPSGVIGGSNATEFKSLEFSGNTTVVTTIANSSEIYVLAGGGLNLGDGTQPVTLNAYGDITVYGTLATTAKSVIAVWTDSTSDSSMRGLIVDGGTLRLNGASPHTGQCEAGTIYDTIYDSTLAMTDGEYNGMRVLMLDGRAKGDVYVVSDTNSIAKYLRINGTADTDTVASVNGQWVTINDGSLITFSGEHVSRYLNFTNGSLIGEYREIISSNASYTMFELYGDLTGLAANDEFVITDGLAVGDNYCVIDPCFFAGAAGAEGNSFILVTNGGEALVEFANISRVGANFDGKYGITAQGLNGSETGDGLFMNCSFIRDAYRGPYLVSSNACVIENCNISRITTAGAHLKDATQNFIRNNRIYDCGEGVKLENSIGNTVEGNVIYRIGN
jgi:parallel beta-helix repeat protein